MPRMKVLYRMSRAIRRFPDAHNQRTWHNDTRSDEYRDPVTTPARDAATQQPPCGTTLCGAGWIAWQNAPHGSKLRGTRVIFPDGTDETIRDFATRVAGLTDGQAEALFIHASDANDLDTMIDYLESNPKATEYELREARYA